MVKPVFSIGATPDSRALREEVFITEQGFHNEFDEQDQDCLTLVLYRDGLPIATGRLIKEDPATYDIGRLAVKKEYRGKGVGRAVLDFLCVKAKEMGATRVKAHSQLDKRGFYIKAGFVVIGDGVVDYDEHCPHIWLAKDLRPYRFRRSKSRI